MIRPPRPPRRPHPGRPPLPEGQRMRSVTVTLTAQQIARAAALDPAGMQNLSAGVRAAIDAAAEQR